MPIKKGQNPNHPKKGSQIKVEAIKDKKAIKRIKKLLSDNPRNYCLFVLGINTALRANELLSIKVGQVKKLKAGDDFEVKERKTKKYKRITLNRPAIESIQALLSSRKLQDDLPLFTGQRKPLNMLCVPTVSNLVKKWCLNVGLKGNYGSHSLRKTWGYWQRVERNTPIPLLMEAFGHATQKQTLDYLGIQDDEIKNIYSSLEL